MKRQTKDLQPIAGIDPSQFWYVPDRRLRTKRAAETAADIADELKRGSDAANELDEQVLFAALHTCAYLAVRRPRGKTIRKAERELWGKRWQRVREYLVERNLGLVYSMISRFGARKIDEDDLLSDAMLGLTRAVDRFNPWRGYRFSTYACNVIARALMRRGKRERHYRRLFPVQFETTFERPEAGPDHNTELYVERLNRALDDNLGELTELESRILAKRFPDEIGTRLTFQEIGETVGLSKERVRQIQNVALQKIRNVLVQDAVLH